MRPSFAALGAVLSLAACGSSSAHPPASTSAAATGTSGPPAVAACGPAGARTIAASAVARVYVSGGAVRGCASGSRRTWVLLAGAPRPGGDRLGRAVVRGRLAAYVLERMGVDTGGATVVERRLDTGRTVADVPANTARLRPESFVSVPGLVLAGSGAFAWISEARSVTGGGIATSQVHAWAHGVTYVLDAGPAIAPASLALRGTRVSWRHGSGRHGSASRSQYLG